MFDLEHIISGKIRLKLLMKLFLNPENKVYLRGLANEFDVSTNTVRQELEKLSESEVVRSEKKKQKRLFSVNVDHPLYESIRQMLLRYTGVETLFEMVIRKLGTIEAAYLTGPLARGVDTSILDVIIVGNVDRNYLNKLILQAEKMTGKKMRIALYSVDEWDKKHLTGIDYLQVIG